MDHISDSFLETNVPLLVLIEAAKSGNEKEVKEYAQVFREHANKLVEVSYELNFLTQNPFHLAWLNVFLSINIQSYPFTRHVLLKCMFVCFLNIEIHKIVS